MPQKPFTASSLRTSGCDVRGGLQDDRGNPRVAVNIAGEGCRFRTLSHYRCAAGAGAIRLRSGKITRVALNKNTTVQKRNAGVYIYENLFGKFSI